MANDDSNDADYWIKAVIFFLAFLVIGVIIGLSMNKTYYENKDLDKSKIQKIDTTKGVDFDTLRIIFYRR